MTEEGDVAIAKTVISFSGRHLGAIDSRRTQSEKIENLEEKTISLRKQTAWVVFYRQRYMASPP